MQISIREQNEHADPPAKERAGYTEGLTRAAGLGGEV